MKKSENRIFLWEILERSLLCCTSECECKNPRLIFFVLYLISHIAAMQIVLNGIFSIGIVCYAVSSVILLIGISEVSWRLAIDR